MASIFFKRLEKKYGKEKLTGKKYQVLITEILAHNNEKASRAVGRLTNKSYQDSVKKLSKKKEKNVKLPDMANVIPKRSVFVIKGADTGKFLVENLRDRLQKDMREVLKKFDGTGKKRMETQRGTGTGKINNELVTMFEKQIKNTFENYTKRDPRYGVPSNIHTIAVTEIRSVVNMVKTEYKNKLVKKNDKVKMRKTWIHNKSLSKKPRETHERINGVTIAHDKKFRVGRPKNKGGGFDWMDRPHDPNAPDYQNYTCNCDILYRALVLE